MNGSQVVQLTIPAKYKNLNVISACIEALLKQVEGIDESSNMSYNVVLAVHEICNNIIKHAYGHEEGQIEAIFTLDTEQCQFQADLYDTGRAFDFASVSEPNLDVPQEEGYGLFLAKQLLDKVEYFSEFGKNHWHLMKGQLT